LKVLDLLQRIGPLTGVLLMGACLFLAAAPYGGLPRNDLGQDEIVTESRVRHGVLRQGPLTPRFNWPNLLIYLSKGALRTARWAERMLELPWHHPILIGRILVATLSMLSLLWLYLAASRLFDHQIGILSAALLALMPLFAYRSGESALQPICSSRYRCGPGDGD
jgi:hypothetical protein